VVLNPQPLVPLCVNWGCQKSQLPVEMPAFLFLFCILIGICLTCRSGRLCNPNVPPFPFPFPFPFSITCAPIKIESTVRRAASSFSFRVTPRVTSCVSMNSHAICMAFGIENGHGSGIWGGESESEPRIGIWKSRIFIFNAVAVPLRTCLSLFVLLCLNNLFTNNTKTTSKRCLVRV